MFADASLPAGASAEQRASFESGQSGELSPLMCVDKDPHALASFAALYPAFLASSLASVVADGFVPTLGAQMAFSAPIVLLVGLLVQWLEYRERRAGPASAEHGASRLAPDSGLPTRKP